MTSPIPQISLDAQILRDRLKKAKVGDVVTYEELTQEVGRDVRGRAKAALYTARNHALKHAGMVFQAVENVGLKRLSDVEIVESVGGDLKLIRRKARKSATKLTKVAFDKLPNEQKIDHNAKLSMLGALQQFSAPQSLIAVRSKVQESNQALSIGRTLDVFK